jgi:hypothetical protein
VVFLTKKQDADIFRCASDGETMMSLSKKYGTSMVTIKRAIQRFSKESNPLLYFELTRRGNQDPKASMLLMDAPAFLRPPCLIFSGDTPLFAYKALSEKALNILKRYDVHTLEELHAWYGALLIEYKSYRFKDLPRAGYIHGMGIKTLKEIHSFIAEN